MYDFIFIVPLALITTLCIAAILAAFYIRQRFLNIERATIDQASVVQNVLHMMNSIAVDCNNVRTGDVEANIVNRAMFEAKCMEQVVGGTGVGGIGGIGGIGMVIHCNPNVPNSVTLSDDPCDAIEEVSVAVNDGSDCAGASDIDVHEVDKSPPSPSSRPEARTSDEEPLLARALSEPDHNDHKEAAPYNQMRLQELRDIMDKHGLPHAKRTKKEIVAVLYKYDQEVAE